MRWRTVALLSLGVNVTLALFWLALVRRPQAGASPAAATLQDGSAGSARPLVVRRQFFSWQEVESPD